MIEETAGKRFKRYSEREREKIPYSVLLRLEWRLGFWRIWRGSRGARRQSSDDSSTLRVLSFAFMNSVLIMNIIVVFKMLG